MLQRMPQDKRLHCVQLQTEEEGRPEEQGKMRVVGRRRGQEREHRQMDLRPNQSQETEGMPRQVGFPVDGGKPGRNVWGDLCRVLQHVPRMEILPWMDLVPWKKW